MSVREEPLVYELSRTGRVGCTLPVTDVPEASPESVLLKGALRETLDLPELSELDVVRHFARLSERQVSLDSSFYPLGSCTMKYNPRINERIARMSGFAALHPLQPEETCQGALTLMYELQSYLAEIGGMHAVSLQPAAGAQGELAGVLIIKAYHKSRGDSGRTLILVPESAHGTNPATVSRAGLVTRKVPCNESGMVDICALRSMLSSDVAGMMLTNPNTLGLFETDVSEICRLIHEAGALMYCDGANLNAIMGRSRPGDIGFDIMHYNLHKTFSTPHGGGGPGAGPVGVKEFLEPFLPVPVTEKSGEGFRLTVDRPHSIGRLHSYYGNFLVMVRAFAYIRTLGAEGLREVSGSAVLNANYLLARLRDTFSVPYGDSCMHEFVTSVSGHRKFGVRALDVAKRLLDFGFHPPTIYFPLIVEEAMMIEPTETESKQTLDAFVDAMMAIDRESHKEPAKVTEAPAEMCVGRVDEVVAARRPNLRWG